MKSMKKIKVIIYILIFISIFFNIKALALTGTINEGTVNVREKNATDSKKVMQVSKNDKVEVLEKVGEWYKITYNNKTGYIYEKYVDVEEEKKQEENMENEETTENVEVNLYVENNTQIKIVPNISSSVIYTTTQKSKVNIIEQFNDWTYASVDNNIGWIRTDKILEENKIVEEEPKVENEEVKEETEKEEVKKEEIDNKDIKTKKAYIKYDTVNLRQEASTDSKVLIKLKLNNEIDVIEEVNTVWSKVKYGDTIGYISTDLISDKKQEDTTKSNDTTSRSGEQAVREETSANSVSQVSSQKNDGVTGQDIVNFAKQFLGYNYTYGGSSPSTGFDCSGLTSYVYKHFGYSLARTTTGQANDGREVAKSNLQPGDIIIFKNNALTKIGHVGIYIGDNKMIHASEPGVGVIITDIDSKAYKYPQRYVTARRIL